MVRQEIAPNFGISYLTYLCRLLVTRFYFWFAMAFCALIEPLLCSVYPTYYVLWTQVIVLAISTILFIIQIIGEISLEWDDIMKHKPPNRSVIVELFVSFMYKGPYVVAFVCLLGGWLFIFRRPGIAVLRCFRVFRLLWYYDNNHIKNGALKRFGPILGEGFLIRLFAVMQFAISALTALCDEMFRFTKKTKGGLVLMLVFFYTAFVFGVAFWIDTGHDNEACRTLGSCMYTMMRLTFFDSRGFDFAYSLSTTGHKWLFTWCMIYLCVTSFGILYGLTGLFGTALINASEEAFELNDEYMLIEGSHRVTSSSRMSSLNLNSNSNSMNSTGFDNNCSHGGSPKNGGIISNSGSGYGYNNRNNSINSIVSNNTTTNVDANDNTDPLTIDLSAIELQTINKDGNNHYRTLAKQDSTDRLSVHSGDISDDIGQKSTITNSRPRAVSAAAAPSDAIRPSLFTTFKKQASVVFKRENSIGAKSVQSEGSEGSTYYTSKSPKKGSRNKTHTTTGGLYGQFQTKQRQQQQTRQQQARQRKQRLPLPQPSGNGELLMEKRFRALYDCMYLAMQKHLSMQTQIYRLCEHREKQFLLRMQQQLEDQQRKGDEKRDDKEVEAGNDDETEEHAIFVEISNESDCYVNDTVVDDDDDSYCSSVELHSVTDGTSTTSSHRKLSPMSKPVSFRRMHSTNTIVKKESPTRFVARIPSSPFSYNNINTTISNVNVKSFITHTQATKATTAATTIQDKTSKEYNTEHTHTE